MQKTSNKKAWSDHSCYSSFLCDLQHSREAADVEFNKFHASSSKGVKEHDKSKGTSCQAQEPEKLVHNLLMFAAAAVHCTHFLLVLVIEDLKAKKWEK